MLGWTCRPETDWCSVDTWHEAVRTARSWRRSLGWRSRTTASAARSTGVVWTPSRRWTGQWRLAGRKGVEDWDRTDPVRRWQARWTARQGSQRECHCMGQVPRLSLRRMTISSICQQHCNHFTLSHAVIITSHKGGGTCFLPVFVCLSVSKITQNAWI